MQPILNTIFNQIFNPTFNSIFNPILNAIFNPIIGVLPAYTQDNRLVGNSTPHLVSYVGTVERAGQLHLREMSRAGPFKHNMS